MEAVPIPRLLIVGVKSGGIGDTVVRYVHDQIELGHDHCGQIFTADLPDVVTRAGVEALDIEDLDKIRNVLHRVRPTHVLCTVGINLYGMEDGAGQGWRDQLQHMMNVNTIGPLLMAREWSEMMCNNREGIYGHVGYHFAAISSNSARIARSMSTAYCASKAALSQGMRCLARDAARQGLHQALYVYEPGWVNGTPMSTTISGVGDSAAEERQNARWHRIPSQLGLHKEDLAHVIVSNFFCAWNLFNGSCIRLDGGEQ